MTTTVREADSSPIEAVCARVRERLADDEARQAEEFVRQYYARVPAEDLAESDPLDLYGAALALWSFGRRRAPGAANVRVYNPEFEQHGWQSPHTVAELVTDDMPFVVDSATMELNRHGIHLIIHPVIHVRRDAAGELTSVLPAGASGEEGALAESHIHIELDRQSGTEEMERLRERLLAVLRDVSAAVDDWQAMRDRAKELIAELREPSPSLDREEFEEAAELLAWMEDRHFTFLGYREYELATQDGEDSLRALPGTGLGILRESTGGDASGFAKLPPRARALARERHPLILTKANTRATVHRPAYLDYVGVKRFGSEGDVVGERRFLGLYTTAAYRATPRRRSSRSSTRIRATSCSRSPRTSCTSSRWASSRSASASGCGCSSGATAMSGSSPASSSSRAIASTRRTASASARSSRRRSTPRASTGSCACRSRCSSASTTRCGSVPASCPTTTRPRSSRGSSRRPARGPTTCTRRCSRRWGRSARPRCTGATATRSRRAIATTGSHARR